MKMLFVIDVPDDMAVGSVNQIADAVSVQIVAAAEGTRAKPERLLMTNDNRFALMERVWLRGRL